MKDKKSTTRETWDACCPTTVCCTWDGRTFSQRFRGYPVELEEIETKLLELPGIKDVVVTASNNNSGDEQLIAYVVPKTVPGPNVSEIRHFMADNLPEYMIPATFISLDALPLTDTLKVDRKALPAPDGLRPAIVALYQTLQEPRRGNIHEVRAEVLELDRVGVHDHFFDLGGHSLAATRVVSRA